MQNDPTAHDYIPEDCRTSMMCPTCGSEKDIVDGHGNILTLDCGCRVMASTTHPQVCRYLLEYECFVDQQQEAFDSDFNSFYDHKIGMYSALDPHYEARCDEAFHDDVHTCHQWPIDDLMFPQDEHVNDGLPF